MAEDNDVQAFRESVLGHGLRYVDAWGAHGVTEKHEPCGCKPVGDGHLKSPLRVELCEAHKHNITLNKFECRALVDLMETAAKRVGEDHIGVLLRSSGHIHLDGSGIVGLVDKLTQGSERTG